MSAHWKKKRLCTVIGYTREMTNIESCKSIPVMDIAAVIDKYYTPDLTPTFDPLHHAETVKITEGTVESEKQMD